MDRRHAGAVRIVEYRFKRTSLSRPCAVPALPATTAGARTATPSAYHLHIEPASQMADPATTQRSPATDAAARPLDVGVVLSADVLGACLLLPTLKSPSSVWCCLCKVAAAMCRPLAAANGALQTRDNHTLTATAAAVCERSGSITQMSPRSWHPAVADQQTGEVQAWCIQMQEPAEAALGARFDLHAETPSPSAASRDVGLTSGSPNNAIRLRRTLPWILRCVKTAGRRSSDCL
ncbi:hypothetical protein K458DRAFT_437036 [Lentithecium fluviatile CBS 122367]|uniref:Uncharacterized protein n=1 Tax=Lentithecium fluviatile CBS 122367 TaxID=1168545 RepID=A0A6G1IFH2_9PLEO|nr:hypothetical protein K458DRAFT_437036 [Lentithecium fluviatile CBS 122367]